LETREERKEEEIGREKRRPSVCLVCLCMIVEMKERERERGKKTHF
jgi:hypothetical protein